MELNSFQKAFRKNFLSSWKFNLFALTQVPMGFIAGMKLTELTPEKSVATIPFRWWNKNPFKSIYFAVQSMAAELSTAAPCLWAVQGHTPSVAFIIVNIEGNFPKKATGKVIFTCESVHEIFETVKASVESGEAKQVRAKTVGRMKDGTIVSEFYFTWSFKQRSK